MRALVAGQVYWLDDCPPLDDNVAKRRPVILVVEQAALDAGHERFLVIPTTTAASDDYDRVEMPNEHEEPGTTSGLPEPCCALPRWVMFVQRTELTAENFAGFLPQVTYDRLCEALELRLDDPDTDGLIGQTD